VKLTSAQSARDRKRQAVKEREKLNEVVAMRQDLRFKPMR
jgi:hypothetical protein